MGGWVGGIVGMMGALEGGRSGRERLPQRQTDLLLSRLCPAVCASLQDEQNGFSLRRPFNFGGVGAASAAGSIAQLLAWLQLHAADLERYVDRWVGVATRLCMPAGGSGCTHSAHAHSRSAATFHLAVGIA